MEETRSRSIDLDALAAAGEEADEHREPPTFVFRGETFTLPEYPPAEAIALTGVIAELSDLDDEAARRHDEKRRGIIGAKMGARLVEFVQVLLGPEEWERFKALRPGVRQMMHLLESWPTFYGSSLGESPASGE